MSPTPLLRPLVALSTCLWLLACGPGAYVEQELEAPAQASGRFEILLERVDRQDRVFEVEAIGAPSGVELVLVVTDASDTSRQCPEEAEPLCLTITGEPSLELESAGDDDGDAWWYVPFGAAGADGTLSVQAYTRSDPPWASNGLRLRVPSPR